MSDDRADGVAPFDDGLLSESALFGRTSAPPTAEDPELLDLDDIFCLDELLEIQPEAVQPEAVQPEVIHPEAVQPEVGQTTDDVPRCWGGIIAETHAACTTGFMPGKSHFKSKFCPACVTGICVPLSRVRACTLELSAQLTVTSKMQMGFWKEFPQRVESSRFRLINNTQPCTGPWIALFEGEPPSLAWAEVPPEWCSTDGTITLRVGKGTLVPVASAFRSCKKRTHEDTVVGSSSCAPPRSTSRASGSVVQMNSALPFQPLPLPFGPASSAAAMGDVAFSFSATSSASFATLSNTVALTAASSFATAPGLSLACALPLPTHQSLQHLAPANLITTETAPVKSSASAASAASSSSASASASASGSASASASFVDSYTQVQAKLVHMIRARLERSDAGEDMPADERSQLEQQLALAETLLAASQGGNLAHWRSQPDHWRSESEADRTASASAEETSGPELVGQAQDQTAGRAVAERAASMRSSMPSSAAGIQAASSQPAVSSLVSRHSSVGSDAAGDSSAGLPASSSAGSSAGLPAGFRVLVIANQIHLSPLEARVSAAVLQVAGAIVSCCDAATPASSLDVLLNGQNVLLFSGHADARVAAGGSRTLVFDRGGGAEAVDAEALVRVIAAHHETLQLVLLNGCSRSQLRILLQPWVTSQSVLSHAAGPN